MNPITLLLVYTFLYTRTDPDDPQVPPEDVYKGESWEFSPTTRTVRYNSFQTQEAVGVVPADLNVNGEFYHECIVGTTTRRGYIHDGYGGFTTDDNLYSTECGFAVPVEGTILRYECRGFDRYRIEADGDGGERAVLHEANATVCGFRGAVRGCTDEDATNYDPNATEDDGSCVFMPKLELEPLPVLSAVHLPMPVVLHSAGTGRMATPASALLSVESLAIGTLLTVNGVVLSVATVPASSSEFNSAATLAEALMAAAPIAARYRVTLLDDENQVRLDALQPGSALTPTVVCSTADITAVITAGVDALRSQTKQQWGCFVEVYVVPGARYGEPVDTNASQLVDRLEQLYQTSNNYTFDLSAALAPLLSHKLTDTSDRMLAYFVRCGEVFVPTGQAIRRRFTIVQSAVGWAVESARPLVAEANGECWLSRPAPRWVVPRSSAYTEQLSFLANAGANVVVAARGRTYNGTPVVRSQSLAAAGGVQSVPLASMLATLQACETITFTVTIGGVLLGSVRMQLVPAVPRARCLVFLSRRGVYEVLWLWGIVLPTPKRQPQLYARGPEQAMRRVEVTEAERLHTGLVDASTLAWLSEELGSSPQLYLFDPVTGLYTDVVLTNLDPDANVVENRYSAQLTLEPARSFAVIPA
jgi:hypothetical protein